MIEIRAINEQSALFPAHGIVLYAKRAGSNVSGDVAYATVHPITLTDGIPQLGAGVGVSNDGLSALFRGLDPQRAEKAVLQKTNILTQGSRWMVWYAPPTVRRVWFKADKIGEKSAEVPLPGLVFAVSPSGWQVFATKSTRRPGASTRLYQAPFFNVWSNGQICTGTTQTPQGDEKRDPKAWERSFYESYFSHSNINDGTLLTYKGGANAFWSAMLEGKFAKFPNEVLFDRGMALKHLLANINKELARE